ncbi:MAG TPA: hypothetical protein VKY82_08935 [Flavobacterium sp.]|nr:hypothetical protein [Flavobacterium sp.]
MRKNFTLLLFLLTTTLSFGQNNYQDVVYLRNGSIIRGVIIEQVPNKSVKIETDDRNVFVYQMEDIEKLAKEMSLTKNKNLNEKGLQAGYRGIIELGLQVGTGDYGMDRLKLNVINGHQFNPYFSLGFGTGLRYYFDADTALIPLFVDFRTNFINNKVSPYLSVGIGYSFDATNNFEGVGLLFNPVMGVNIKVSDNSAFNIGIGYEIQKMDFYYDPWMRYGNTFKANSGSINFNIGISF